MKRTPLRTRRKKTGELELFTALYHERDGVSELSGRTLYPPGHFLFHHQGSHLLPKGTYPDYRLDPRNIVMLHPIEHTKWEHTRNTDDLGPEWGNIIERYQRTGVAVACV